MFGHKNCPQDREISIDTAKFESVFVKVCLKDALHGGVTDDPPMRNFPSLWQKLVCSSSTVLSEQIQC